MADFLSNYIRKRRDRSSASSSEEISTSPEAKKLKDMGVHDSDINNESIDEVMEALEKIESISLQLNSILTRLNKLDSIEDSVKNIETCLSNLTARTAKLEQFEITTAKNIKDLQDSCSFNGDTCKELQDQLKEQTAKINSLMINERSLHDQIRNLNSKDLYLEAYSRRENIKFFSIPEEQDEDTLSNTKKFYGKRPWIPQRSHCGNATSAPSP